jgi:hypothetical protein
MAGTFNPNFNPAQVMMGGGGKAGGGSVAPEPPIKGPYLPTSPVAPTPSRPVSGGNPIAGGIQNRPTAPIAKPIGSPGFGQNPAPPAPPKPTINTPNVLGPQAIRATGTGPYDPAYRQDLATYAGGNFLQPQGGLNFNPTATPGQSGQLGGNPTGGGSAPVQGLPTDLITQALGGQSFGYTPPAPASATTAVQQPQDWQNWLNSIMGNQNLGGTRVL